jgi:hypothetical protein
LVWASTALAAAELPGTGGGGGGFGAPLDFPADGDADGVGSADGDEDPVGESVTADPDGAAELSAQMLELLELGWAQPERVAARRSRTINGAVNREGAANREGTIGLPDVDGRTRVILRSFRHSGIYCGES